MKNYMNILVAVELKQENDCHLLEKAKEIAKEYVANIALVHAIENLFDYGEKAIDIGFGQDKTFVEIGLEENLMAGAQKGIDVLGEQLGVARDKRVVKMGTAKLVILEEAKKFGSDLIIVGSHGRHGLRAILGSTANAVLHGADCDVLTVRVKG
jgi:universal stress protein A